MDTACFAEWAESPQLKPTETWVQVRNTRKASSSTPAPGGYVVPQPVIQTSGKVDVPITPPSAYNGTPEKYNEFVTTLDLYLQINKVVFTDDAKKIAFTLSLMRGGTAGPWAIQKMHYYLDNSWPSYKDFSKEVQDMFLPVDLKCNMMMVLSKLKQGSM